MTLTISPLGNESPPYIKESKPAQMGFSLNAGAELAPQSEIQQPALVAGLPGAFVENIIRGRRYEADEIRRRISDIDRWDKNLDARDHTWDVKRNIVNTARNAVELMTKPSDGTGTLDDGGRQRVGRAIINELTNRYKLDPSFIRGHNLDTFVDDLTARLDDKIEWVNKHGPSVRN